jgi:hypothetical protein
MNPNSNLTQTQLDTLKWIPKFTVVNKRNKSILLYDYEPTNEYIKENFNAIHQQQQHGVVADDNSEDAQMPSFNNTGKLNDFVYRLDNSIRKELFINYWRNRVTKFELNLADKTEEKLLNYHTKPTTPSHTEQQPSVENTSSLINEYEPQQSPVHNEVTTNTPSSSSNSSSHHHSTFRLAALSFFSKKDKSSSQQISSNQSIGEKVKHSSLKRAKSGIQLERKKQSQAQLASNVSIVGSGGVDGSSSKQLDESKSRFVSKKRTFILSFYYNFIIIYLFF